jgi:hypothetical protein
MYIAPRSDTGILSGCSEITKNTSILLQPNMTTAAIRDRLYDYIKVADDKKIKAIYMMLEDDITAKHGPRRFHFLYWHLKTLSYLIL